ncbi:MAG: hypothetical protein Kow0090_18140 [Myxococcota bacterium]
MNRKLKPKIARSDKKPLYPTLSDFLREQRFGVKKNSVGILVVVLGTGISSCEVPPGVSISAEPEAEGNDGITLRDLIKQGKYSQLALPSEGNRTLWFDFYWEMTYNLTLFVYDLEVADFIKKNTEKFLSLSDEELLRNDSMNYRDPVNLLKSQQNILNAFKGELHINNLPENSLKAVSFNLVNFKYHEELSGGAPGNEIIFSLPTEGTRYADLADYSGSITYRLNLSVYSDELDDRILADSDRFLKTADDELRKYHVADFYDKNTIPTAQKSIWAAFNKLVSEYGLSSEQAIGTLSLEVIAIEDYTDIGGGVAAPQYWDIDLTGEQARFLEWNWEGSISYKLTAGLYGDRLWSFISDNLEKMLLISDKSLLAFSPGDFYSGETVQKAREEILAAFRKEISENGFYESDLESIGLEILSVSLYEDIGGDYAEPGNP